MMMVWPQRVLPQREVGQQVPGSRLRFRDPLAGRVSGVPSVMFVGGADSFGNYVARPYAKRFAQDTGLAVCNCSAVGAGWEALFHDPVVLKQARSASLVIWQLMGPQLRSNPFFQVHPRHNDRFLRPCAPLRQLYPQTDFSHIGFVGHLMRVLLEQDAYAFRRLQLALQQDWVTQFTRLRQLCPRPLAFLWLDHGLDMGLGQRFHGLTRARLRVLGLGDIPMLRVAPDPKPVRPMMLHPAGDHAPASVLSGAYHQRIADALCQWVPPLLGAERRSA